jgi:tetratricopeptide (TPR) repeat protein
MDPSWPLPRAGARQLLALLRARLGHATVEQAIAPQRATLSLVLRGLEGQLTAEERAQRAEQSGLSRGLLPSRNLSRRHLVEAWAACFAALFAGRTIVLVIPNVATFDIESLALIRPLLQRQHGAGSLRFVLGHEPSFGPADHLARRCREIREQELLLLEMLPEAVVETLAGAARDPAVEQDGNAARPPSDPLDDHAERRAHETLMATADMPAAACKAVVQGMRAAFGAFGFPAALRLARGLLERQPTPPAAAEIHTIAALSACCLLPDAGGDAELVELAEHHFSHALALEADPARRVHLLYRLCMLNARVKQDLVTALKCGDEAVEAARSQEVLPGRPAYVAAWAHNGRAYVRFRGGCLAEATADCERALQLLQLAEAGRDVPASRVAGARVDVSSNLARLAATAGDRARARAWLALCEEEAEALAPSAYLPFIWLSVRLAEDDLLGAARRYTALLANAQRAGNPDLEALCAHCLGDLYYRLGDARVAYVHFCTAWQTWRFTSDYPDDILTAEVNCAVTAFRAGWLDAAEAGFQRLLRHPLCSEPAAQAEFLGALAIVAARRGDTEQVEALAPEALQKARESSERDVLVRVARSAGEAYLTLQRWDAARQAFELAWAQAADGADNRSPIPAEDRLGVLMGLQECNPTDPHLTLQALLLVPAALEDVNAWWELPRLLPRVARLAEQGLVEQDGAETAQRRVAAQRMIEAGLQRQDGQEAAARLRHALVQSALPSANGG